ncbi:MULTISPECIES: hypothetical protein [unclassified Mesorhizobium]|nr:MULTISPECIES: hypothetical protein [unclassified Mesorhizobium]
MVSETLTSAPTGRQAIQSTNVFVDANGIVYSPDYNAGLATMEYDR